MANLVHIYLTDCGVNRGLSLNVEAKWCHLSAIAVTIPQWLGNSEKTFNLSGTRSLLKAV